MEELSGKGQKASTHIGSVGVDITVVERDCATVDVDATTSILPNNKARQQKQAPQWGDGTGHGGVFGGVCNGGKGLGTLGRRARSETSYAIICKAGQELT